MKQEIKLVWPNIEEEFKKILKYVRSSFRPKLQNCVLRKKLL